MHGKEGFTNKEIYWERETNFTFLAHTHAVTHEFLFGASLNKNWSSDWTEPNQT